MGLATGTWLFQFIPQVLDWVEVRALGRPVKFFHTELGSLELEHKHEKMLTGLSAYFWPYSVHTHTLQTPHTAAASVQTYNTPTQTIAYTHVTAQPHCVPCIQTHSHTHSATAYGRPTASCALSLVCFWR